MDGFHPENLGRLLMGKPRFVACTPVGVMKLLDEAGAKLSGARAVVVGRSNIVGKPMAVLLTAADATVTVCHSRTRDLAGEVAARRRAGGGHGPARDDPRQLDQAGRRGHRRGHQPHARRQAGGDVEFAAAAERAAAITPVPGGVGPMTIAMLLDNTLLSAKRRAAARGATS